jgi:hypothetical protein
MTAQANDTRNERARFDRWLSYAVLVILVALWVALMVTVPQAATRSLTLDITCRSGNAVVGVWVENASGASGWAQRSGPSGSAGGRFIFRQLFDADYEVRVGCGGNADDWGVVARSARSRWSYRRMLCDDVDFTPPAPAPCRDELTG